MNSAGQGLASLRRLASQPATREVCELCASVIPEQHQHLIDPRSRRLLCACAACAILFDHSAATQYRRVPRDIRELSIPEDQDVMWNSLPVPVDLVFLYRSSVSGGITAVYPSPAGPTETTVDEDVWQDLSAFHPSLKAIREDVEALLINRTKGARHYFIVPIDQCYKLTGLIRQHWHGFSGGSEAWSQIDSFFEDLKRVAHA